MMVLRSVSMVPPGTRGGRDRLCEGKSKEASNGIGGGLLISRSAGNKSSAGQAWKSLSSPHHQIDAANPVQPHLSHCPPPLTYQQRRHLPIPPLQQEGSHCDPDSVADSPFGSYAPDVSYSSGAATHAFRSVFREEADRSGTWTKKVSEPEEN